MEMPCFGFCEAASGRRCESKCVTGRAKGADEEQGDGIIGGWDEFCMSAITARHFTVRVVHDHCGKGWLLLLLLRSTSYFPKVPGVSFAGERSAFRFRCFAVSTLAYEAHTLRTQEFKLLKALFTLTKGSIFLR